MAGKKNQVTLTFAGDSGDLEKAFDRVGASADEMSSEVKSASNEVGNAGAGFDRAGEATDALDQRSMGFRDTLTGVQDSMLGLSEVAKGNLFEGFLTLGMGVGDLASGFTNLLIPAVKNAGKWLKLLGKAGAIGLIITAVTVLTVLIIKNWDTIWKTTKKIFSSIWNFLKGLWDKITGFIGKAIGFIKDVFFKFHPLGIIIKNWGGIWRWIVNLWNNILGFLKTIPRKIGNFFSGIGNIVTAPFRAAFNGIKNLWNSTVGGFGFTVPDWIPVVGGQSFTIPTLHQGGVVPGAPGTETMALLQAGEKISPASQTPKTVALTSDGSDLSDLIVGLLRNVVRAEGGNVQFVLGQE